MDIGLRNHLLGFRNRDSGHMLENVIYFELLRRGYDVAIGKVDNAEVDFIATKADDKLYVQVTESMTGEDVRRRELDSLQKINDNYEKVVLSLDTGLDASYTTGNYTFLHRHFQSPWGFRYRWRGCARMGHDKRMSK